MSMLAEKKRKQKWSLNPRGNDWVQDSNKFGQKMLERMGWQHGKGLGAKEDGIKEHIKVSYKNDSKGMGYKESNDQWTEHETHYSALLESLSGGKTDEIKINSLEKKSQSSRARVHYHKFTRGKDLSRYSEKDLANIFGKKSMNETKTVEETVPPDNVEEKNKFLLNAGSMSDYFKKKLASFGKSTTNGYVIGQNGVLKKESDWEDDFKPSFNFKSEDEAEPSYVGFGVKPEKLNEDTESDTKATFISYVNNSHESTERIRKKKRKGEVGDIDDDTPKKKSRKSKKSVSELDDSKGVSNPAFNPLGTPVKVQKRVLDTIDESMSEDVSDVDESVPKREAIQVEIHDVVTEKKQRSERNEDTKIKKKSKKLKPDSAFEEISVDTTPNGEIDEAELPRQNFNDVKIKKSKKKRSDKAIDDIVTVEDCTVTPVTDESCLKSKKKSKNKNISLQSDATVSSVKEDVPSFALDNPNFEDALENSTVSQVVDNPYEVKPKKKKKKDRKVGLDNANFSESVEENPYEIKVKRKKNKAKDEGVDNVGFDEVIGEVTQSEDNPYEVKIKRKKKKRGECYATENPNFNVSLEETNSIETEENPYEVKPKTKKKKEKKHDFALDNPNFDSTDSNAVETTGSLPSSDLSLNIIETDLMLNIVTTPIIKKPNLVNGDHSCNITPVNSVKRRKSVRFSDVTQEHIIPNNDDLQNLSDIENRNELFEINTQVIKRSVEEQDISFELDESKRSKKRKLGLDNAGFDKQRTNLEENLNVIANTIDKYEAELDNDINEKKLESLTMDDMMIGEVGNPDGDNEGLAEGAKLKFKSANFLSRTPFYHMDKTGPRKSYKHLIKGDILVGFKNTNLHEIQGYAVRSVSTEV